MLKVYRYFRYGPRGGDAPESCTGLNFQPEDAFEESSVTAAEAAKLRPVTLLGGLDPILEEEPEEDLLFDTSGGVEEIPAPALRPLLNPGVLLDYANLGANSPMSVASQEEAILASMAVALLPADWGLFHLHTRYSSSGTVLNTIWLFRDMLLFWTFQSNDQPLVFLRYYGLGAVTDYVPYIVGLRTTRASAAPIPNVVKMFGEAFTTLEAEAVKALGPEVVTQVPDADQVSAVLSLLG